MNELKAELHNACVKLVEERIQAIHDITAVAESSALDETKSSAGDKYETGREMLKQEMEKNAAQLDEAMKQKQMLLSLTKTKAENTIGAGALVETDKMFFYIAVGLGQVKFGNRQAMVISPVSPIGKMLLGKTAGEKFSFNSAQYHILNIS